MNIEKYNVVWTEQSKNSGETMPVGGFDTGLNVWTENNEIMFYMDRSGSFDENNQMLKLGRVRLTFDPCPFELEGSFKQELHLDKSVLSIANPEKDFEVQIWVEMHRPVIHIETKGSFLCEMKVGYESWRLEKTILPRERRHAACSYIGYPGEVYTKPDTVFFDEDNIVFYHRNEEDLLFDKLVQQQGFESVKDQLWDPQTNLTFGGMIAGENFVRAGESSGEYTNVPYKSWILKSAANSANHHVCVQLHKNQTETAEVWLDQCKEHFNETRPWDEIKKETQDWWEEYWERSHLYIDPEQKDETSLSYDIGRNYQLMRYLLGCNAYGEYPSKFNGSLFTSDPVNTVGEDFAGTTPDFRQWGGGNFTGQNQRLMYWPMLKTGDFDMMPSQFDFYNRTLENARIRTKLYWGHDGCSFVEQIENFGLANGWAYGWIDSYDPTHNRRPTFDKTELTGPWIRYYYTTQLEFALMILRYHQFSGIDISNYMPLIHQSIKFFDEHYRFVNRENTISDLDEDGKLVFYPSTACETYKNATNPTDLIAGMKAAVQAVLELDDHLLSAEDREYYENLLTLIPEIPYREMQNRKVISPAHHWTAIMNAELPQMYPVFPYDLFRLGSDDLQIAIDTWHYGYEKSYQKSAICWHQDLIFCARLGLTDEAKDYAIQKLGNAENKFPVFWNVPYDWLPDMDRGGCGMIGIQEMLMQTFGKEILLFPAWPKEWDVDFKMYAPYQTTVSGSLRDGKLVDLVVEPAERKNDIQIMGGIQV